MISTNIWYYIVVYLFALFVTTEIAVFVGNFYSTIMQYITALLLGMVTGFVMGAIYCKNELD